MTIPHPRPVKVFISYAHADAARINRLEAYLIGYGFDLWIDRQIPGGDQWAQLIEEKIAECDVVVVGLSPAAVDSPWVTDELLYARQLGKPIIPALLQAVERIPLVLISFQYIAMQQESDDLGLQQLRQRLVETGRAAIVLPPHRAVPTARRISATLEERLDDPEEELVPLPAPQPAPDLDRLFQDGINAVALGDYDLAEPNLRQVVERTTDPNRRKTAAEQLKHVHQRLLPLQLTRLRLRARNAEQQGAWNEAIETWQVLLRQAPKRSLLLRARAHRYVTIDQQNKNNEHLYHDVRAMLARHDVSGARNMWQILKRKAPQYSDPDHLYQRLGYLTGQFLIAFSSIILLELVASVFLLVAVISPFIPHPAMLIWTFSTHGPVGSSPTAADGVVYVGSNDGKLYALNATTGSSVWQYQTGGVVGSSPTVANGVVYVGDSDANLYAIDASTGALDWKYQTGDIIDSSPTVANGVVYVGSNDGNVYALDASTGSVDWTYKTSGKVHGSPTVANGIVYVGSGDDSLYALNAVTGSPVWTDTTGGVVESTPTIADGRVYVGSDNGSVYALNAHSGLAIWTFQTAGAVESSPTVANFVVNQLVYVGSSDGKVYAVNANTGTLKWSYQTVGYVRSSPAIINDLISGVVYVGSSDGKVYALNAAIGSLVWTYQTGGRVLSSPTIAIVGVRTVVYIGSDDDNVYALNA